MKKKFMTSGILSVMFMLTVALLVIGQIKENPAGNRDPLVVRFERAVKLQERRFKGGRKIVRGEPTKDYSYLDWELHKDYVSVNVSDYYNSEEALAVMKYYLTEIRPAYQAKIKLTDLGDEAYLESGKNSTYIKLRKGNVVLSISATKPTLAKRFAGYFVREIEKRDRGQL